MIQAVRRKFSQMRRQTRPHKNPETGSGMALQKKRSKQRETDHLKGPLSERLCRA